MLQGKQELLDDYENDCKFIEQEQLFNEYKKVVFL
jgi:hypothetical protein